MKLQVNVLKASLLCVGVNDVRHCLQGVAINSYSITSTDGNILFNHVLDEDADTNEKRLIIHNEDLKLFLKSLDKGVSEIELINNDGCYYLKSENKTQLVALIAANYPDVMRVINSADLGIGTSDGITNVRLNSDYLILTGKVKKALKLHKYNHPYFNFSTKNDTCIISFDNCSSKLYLMPCRES